MKRKGYQRDSQMLTLNLPRELLKSLEEVAKTADMLVADVVKIIVAFAVVRQRNTAPFEPPAKKRNLNRE